MIWVLGQQTVKTIHWHQFDLTHQLRNLLLMYSENLSKPEPFATVYLYPYFSCVAWEALEAPLASTRIQLVCHQSTGYSGICRCFFDHASTHSNQRDYSECQISSLRLRSSLCQSQLQWVQTPASPSINLVCPYCRASSSVVSISRRHRTSGRQNWPYFSFRPIPASLSDCAWCSHRTIFAFAWWTSIGLSHHLGWHPLR